jgi:hypothetical protein
MRRLGLLAFTILALNMLGGEALAGPEWCDDGSPPPNDFRLRPTGVPSAGSSTAWLGSTTGGVLILSLGINTLTGGVAHGMTTALEHARPYATLPSASK